MSEINTTNKLKDIELNYLFILGRYFPETSTNGINVSRIIEQLEIDGNHVTCISLSSEKACRYITGATLVYTIRQNAFERYQSLYDNGDRSKKVAVILSLLRAIRKCTSVLKLPLFPNVSPITAQKEYLLAKKLMRMEKYDCVIGVCRPFCSVAVTARIKKNCEGIMCAAYCLDVLSAQSPPRFITKFAFDLIRRKGEVRYYKKLDRVYLPISCKSEYEHIAYSEIADRIEFIDFPLLNNRFYNENQRECSDKIRLLYAGTLDREYRNPEPMLLLLKEIAKESNVKIVLKLFIRGNCDSIIHNYTGIQGMEVITNGIIDQKSLLKEIHAADVLINISNNLNSVVPCKIFELFSTGKPILNFYTVFEDYTLRYFSLYPNSLSIYTGEWQQYIEHAVKFLQSDLERVHYQDLEMLFYRNTPEYTAGIIRDDTLKLKKNEATRI